MHVYAFQQNQPTKVMLAAISVYEAGIGASTHNETITHFSFKT